MALYWRYYLTVSRSLQIKNVPDSVHAVFRRRAGEAGQSLQEYMLAYLTREAERPTLSEVLGRIEHRTGGSLGFETAAKLVREDRDSH